MIKRILSIIFFKLACVVFCSLWHVSIYMGPFFFLCSKRVKRTRHSGLEEASSSYELAEIQDMSKDEENQKDQNEKIGSSKNFGQP